MRARVGRSNQRYMHGGAARLQLSVTAVFKIYYQFADLLFNNTFKLLINHCDNIVNINKCNIRGRKLTSFSV